MLPDPYDSEIQFGALSVFMLLMAGNCGIYRSTRLVQIQIAVEKHEVGWPRSPITKLRSLIPRNLEEIFSEFISLTSPISHKSHR